MTWTVFEHQHGDNETTDDAPGRGGYKYVLVPVDAETAVEWWLDEYDADPTREVTPSPRDDPAWFERTWDVSDHVSPDTARGRCGELELKTGGIGSPMTRKYTWAELNGRLDVRVVTADEL